MEPEQTETPKALTVIERLKRVKPKDWAKFIGLFAAVILLKSWAFSPATPPDESADAQETPVQYAAPMDKPHVMARNFRAGISVSEPMRSACLQMADNMDGVADNGMPEHAQIRVIEEMAGNMIPRCWR